MRDQRSGREAKQLNITSRAVVGSAHRELEKHVEAEARAYYHPLRSIGTITFVEQVAARLSM